MVKDHFQRPDGYVHQLIKHKARSLCRLGVFGKSDYEDIVQELWLHLLEREAQYDASRASFETFANRVLTNKVRSIIRHRTAAKRNPNREEASLNNQVESSNPDAPKLSDTIADLTFPSPEDAGQHIDIQNLIERMPEQDREPLSHFIDGMTKRDLQNRFGLSRRQVSELLRRAVVNAKLLGMDEW